MCNHFLLISTNVYVGWLDDNQKRLPGTEPSSGAANSWWIPTRPWKVSAKRLVSPSWGSGAGAPHRSVIIHLKTHPNLFLVLNGFCCCCPQETIQACVVDDQWLTSWHCYPSCDVSLYQWSEPFLPISLHSFQDIFEGSCSARQTYGHGAFFVFCFVRTFVGKMSSSTWPARETSDIVIITVRLDFTRTRRREIFTILFLPFLLS